MAARTGGRPTRSILRRNRIDQGEPNEVSCEVVEAISAATDWCS